MLEAFAASWAELRHELGAQDPGFRVEDLDPEQYEHLAAKFFWKYAETDSSTIKDAVKELAA